MNPPSTVHQTTAPLAERMRPKTLADFVGQDDLLGPDKLLQKLVSRQKIPSLLLWGPPGSGKTSLASILAHNTSMDFVYFSAVLSGVKEVRQIVLEAKENIQSKGLATMLFVDEIHRFNKGQQDAFLPHVESGLFTLIGATTENPSFHVIAPLLSRCRVLVLKPLQHEDLKTILNRALTDTDKGLGTLNISVTSEAISHLVNMADGDARSALNSLEIAASLVPSKKNNATPQIIDVKIVEEACQRRTLRYDKNGEEHYNLISALHKSLRDSDPDGSLYWLVRMLEAGEEPLYIARRLIRFASEDIGNADPQALNIAMNSQHAYHVLGSPEGELALAQAVIYLATAPKSNAIYTAYNRVKDDIKKTGSLPVPLNIRNAPTRLMRELDYGKNYKYAHDHEHGLVEQDHLPPELSGTQYYYPTNRGFEATIHDRLTKWRRILKNRKSHTDGDPKK